MTGALPFVPWSDGAAPTTGAFRMGLRPIAAEAWLPPIADLEVRLAQRRAALAAHGRHAFACPAASRPAAEELCSLLDDLGVGAASRPVLAKLPGEPLLDAAARVPDDLCLLGPDEQPRLLAGVLTAPSGWRLDERLGQDLRALHAPVAGLEEAIGGRMRDFLARLPADRIFERGNWHLYDDGRYWRPSGDPLWSVPAAIRTLPEVASRLWLRCERQTLRRLPDSGWILFSIRIHCYPVTELAAHPRLARHFRQAMASLDDAERRARRLHLVGAGLDAWLAHLPERNQGECEGEGREADACCR